MCHMHTRLIIPNMIVIRKLRTATAPSINFAPQGTHVTHSQLWGNEDEAEAWNFNRKTPPAILRIWTKTRVRSMAVYVMVGWPRPSDIDLWGAQCTPVPLRTPLPYFHRFLILGTSRIIFVSRWIHRWSLLFEFDSSFWYLVTAWLINY